MKKAFTLIELLVVIAIIAILAAILFPVFAQAKAAAKKSSDISGMKQVALGTLIYATDSDDTFPSAYPLGANGTVYSTFWFSVPSNWNPSYPAVFVPEDENAWANSTQPYIKNNDIFKSASGLERAFPMAVGTPLVKAPTTVNFTFNGLLHNWSATAIDQPSKLRMFSQNRGSMNMKGWGYSNPRLSCPTAAAGCRFIPSSPTCSGANGTWSEMFINSTYSQWVHGRGQVAVASDSSVKFTNMSYGPNTRSDFKTSFWTRFDTKGASITEWQETNFCHTMLFQPDFDFSNFGTPIEY